jgi:uncharacterized protein (TIGR04255 family)
MHSFSQTMNSSLPPLPSYQNPPVVEVSFGIIFKTLQKMQSRHFGEFWVEHRDEFPATQDNSPLLDATDLAAERLMVMQTPPLRRMMCYSGDGQYVAQIQDARLHFNWRRTKPDDRYPRYHNVLSRFRKFRSEFTEFVTQRDIGPLSVLRFELSYFNHIELGTDIAAAIEEHIQYFRFSPLKDSYLSPPETVSAVWRFAMPDQRGSASASLNNATDQTGKNLLLLVLTCTGAPSDKYSDEDWYNSAHEWIVRSFTDLTTPQAHQKWGRER